MNLPHDQESGDTTWACLEEGGVERGIDLVRLRLWKGGLCVRYISLLRWFGVSRDIVRSRYADRELIRPDGRLCCSRLNRPPNA